MDAVLIAVAGRESSAVAPSLLIAQRMLGDIAGDAPPIFLRDAQFRI